MKALVIESEIEGVDGLAREFAEAINLETGRVEEIRVKGYAKDWQKDGCSSAQSILDEV